MGLCFNLKHFDKKWEDFNIDICIAILSDYVFMSGSLLYMEMFISDCINELNITQKDYENIIMLIEEIFFSVNLNFLNVDFYNQNYYKTYCEFKNTFKNIEKFKNIIIMKDILN